jgi:hypothetical protein
MWIEGVGLEGEEVGPQVAFAEGPDGIFGEVNDGFYAGHWVFGGRRGRVW